MCSWRRLRTQLRSNDMAWLPVLLLATGAAGSPQLSKRQVTDPTPDQAEINFANLVCTVYATNDITCPNNL
jgi:hypothetical protein